MSNPTEQGQAPVSIESAQASILAADPYVTGERLLALSLAIACPGHDDSMGCCDACGRWRG
jgi:hypothetical protein